MKLSKKEWGLFPSNSWGSLFDEVENVFQSFLSVPFKSTVYPYNLLVDSSGDVKVDVLEVALAGVSQDRVNVSVVEDATMPYVKISVEHKDQDKNAEVVYKKTTDKAFYCTFGLPNHDLKAVQAELKDGMLRVRAPRNKPQEPVVRQLLG